MQLRPRPHHNPLPLYANPDAGGFEKVRRQLGEDVRVRIEATPPAQLAAAVQQAAARDTARVLVSGGDGTIALAASVLAGSATELAVIPGGTLNNFVRRTGIPLDPAQALDLALYGTARPLDVGYVNDRLFINSSTVGAFPVFVRSRKYLQKRMPYMPASIIAGLRGLLKYRRVRVMLAGRELKTPLVFLGVGERELRLPYFGRRKPSGRRGLHLLAVGGGSTFSAFLCAFKSLIWGIDPLTKEQRIESRLVEGIELEFRYRRRLITITLDGETAKLSPPLCYRWAPDEILVVLPDIDRPSVG